MSAWVWIGVAVVTQFCGLVALRLAAGPAAARGRRVVLVVLANIGLSGSVLPVGRAVAEGMPLAVAYAAWTGAAIAFAALGGLVLFGERPSRRQALGLLVLVLGVVLLEGGG
ncbi:hypothetical protein GCM10011519_17790 [Marmoricola endophyticus]|uniref:QacE family quaternary ammonium compound efflux SMR transporter n=1 Tax=Marmoricola endophyticus TaxID=2040280 RepID=A0A917BI80_9ACTN|nr:SMR family transporter [Marmoricola endophyticus]GGF44343.1 hypothetical protein GCM10011519_17790 [Marmoricola endophyticus]